MSCDARSTVMKDLEWIIRALAQTADVQIALFPAFVCVADELALDFDEHYQRFVGEGCSASVGSEAKQAMEALDRHLSSFSGPEHAELWTDEALRHAPEWRQTRQLAREIIARMGWPPDPPPTGRAIYVGPDA